MFKKEPKDTDNKKGPEASDQQTKESQISLTDKEYQQLKKAAAEKDDVWDKYLRLHAEYDNSKKLWEKNKTDLLRFGNFRILKEFVTVLDEIEAALLNLEIHKDDKNHAQGLKIIYTKIKEVLTKEGLRPIEAENKKFDPHLHEALFYEERDDIDEHTVIEIIQKGYTYEDKVLRPAKVKVSLKPKDSESTQNRAENTDKEEKEEDIDKPEGEDQNAESGE
ncbi:MAG: nucleotide exchange factor GrpE [Candidatus Omnitrophica bacterium]|nr:nucleotide exchange factor GrpE [Candidatus Omnitrophota bacterium]